MKSQVGIDFVLYLGDPDEGAEAIDSETALQQFDTYREKIPLDDVLYGSVTVRREGKELLGRTPDPILKLMTSLVRIVPYVIEGEPETALLTESEHGFLVEPAVDKVMLTFFRGSDAYEPDEYLLEGASMSLQEFGNHIVGMAERLLGILKKAGRADRDEAKDLAEFLGVGREAVKSYRLEREHGLR